MTTSGKTPERPISGAIAVETFTAQVDGEGWSGEFASAYRPADLEAALKRLMDPGAATQTVHWGRNYLYRTTMVTAGDGRQDVRLDVVVKQFRNLGLKKRLDRKYRGSKAWRSWKMSRLFAERGIPTADPVLWIESDRDDGPSFFVCRHLPGRMESRLLFRSANADPSGEGSLDKAYPGFDFEAFLEAVAEALRRMHEAGLFHRDLSIGNVLLPRSAVSDGAAPLTADDLDIIDLNRARDCGSGNGSPNLWQRSRDLCRLTIFRSEHRRIFLDAYWRESGGGTWLRRLAYYLCHWGFYAKINSKKTIRAPFKRLGVWLKPRRAHVHIPDAPKDAGTRDKIVWDHLSDQPHQHASRWEKLKVRLADLPAHLRGYAALLGAIPRIAARYRKLHGQLYGRPVPWHGAGVCVRPDEGDPDLPLRLLEELGLHHVLLRLHPWQETHEAEEELARRLHERGYELTFALPQNRDLVRHPALWRRRVEDLARRFVPYGRHFQVGQAINRSKWGIWVVNEYLRLARDASEILRRVGREMDVAIEVMGPAVIDFEVYSTASVLNLPTCPPFDAVASLLYVDRRGAPENRQLGFDSVDKVVLVQAIAEASKASAGRSWITEVNWPLWEGPHSPAGKSASVSEAHQADYLARFYLLALTTGQCERVFWWQLVARGYGLTTRIDPDDPTSGLRLRSSFRALRTLEGQLRGRTFLRPIRVGLEAESTADDDVYLFLFSAPSDEEHGADIPEALDRSTDGGELLREGRLVAGWCVSGRRVLTWAMPPREVVEQDGSAADLAKMPSPFAHIEVGESVRYFHL